MKQITITLTIKADRLPLNEFAEFIQSVAEDMDTIEEKIKKQFPNYEVQGTSMKVDDVPKKTKELSEA